MPSWRVIVCQDAPDALRLAILAASTATLGLPSFFPLERAFRKPAMDPGSAVGKYFQGLAQFALNHNGEAEKSAHDALWRSAGEADAYILLAKIHHRNHNPEAVMVDVGAYLQLEPHGPLEEEAHRLLVEAQHEIKGSVAPSR